MTNSEHEGKKTCLCIMDKTSETYKQIFLEYICPLTYLLTYYVQEPENTAPHVPIHILHYDVYYKTQTPVHS
jgi:hypothetical protein